MRYIMSSSTLQNLLSSVLESPALVELGSKAGEKAISIIKEYFTLTGNEISKAYQDSYGYSLAAISVGLATPDQKLAFVQKFLHAKVTREFSDTIEINYLQPFAKQRGFETDNLPSLRKQFIGDLKKVVKYKDQLFQVEKITEEDLTALISYQDSPAISDLLLKQMQGIVPVDETLLAFLRSDELLGKAMRFFFHDIVRKDDRVCKTQAALQQEGLCIEVRNLQTAIKTAEDNLTQAIIEKSSHLAEIAQQLQQLQQVQTSRSEQFDQFTQQFSAWRDLLNYQVEQVLDGLWQIQEKLEYVHDDVKETKGLVETILLKLEEHIAHTARLDLSSQVRLRDELSRQNTSTGTSTSTGTGTSTSTSTSTNTNTTQPPASAPRLVSHLKKKRRNFQPQPETETETAFSKKSIRRQSDTVLEKDSIFLKESISTQPQTDNISKMEMEKEREMERKREREKKREMDSTSHRNQTDTIFSKKTTSTQTKTDTPPQKESISTQTLKESVFFNKQG